MSRFNPYFKASAIAAAVVMSLSSAPRRPYSPREKAFFTDAATIDFVRPGLTITVNSAAIASDGTITVSFTLADPVGLPLDNACVLTPGTISTSFVAGVLPQNSGDHTTYTTNAATGATLGSILQPARTRGKTLTEVAASMWNHEPIMSKAGATPVKFAPGEMKDLLGYLWSERFFEEGGLAAAGRRVFAAKRCASCHENASGKAPKLAGSFNGATMVSALWRHGPSMLSEMKKEGVAWPRFDGSQMADLIAYLNTKK